jgi:hypothetical protein
MAKKQRSAEPKKSVLRDVKEVAAVEQYWQTGNRPDLRKPRKNYKYVDELAHLQFELIKLQEWVRLYGLKVVVIFEGRDAAGKGGVIKRIVESLNPRICRVVALGTPTERQRSQWYFQRYVYELPAKGEIVLFDHASSMIDWLAQNQSRTILISLDHDLPVTIAPDNDLAYEIFLVRLPSTDHLDALVMKFAGVYGHGASGNGDAEYMSAVTRAAISFTRPRTAADRRAKPPSCPARHSNTASRCRSSKASDMPSPTTCWSKKCGRKAAPNRRCACTLRVCVNASRRWD